MLSLESCAQQSGILQRFHPALKIVATWVFILCVMSCARDQILLLLPYIVALCFGLGISKIPVNLFLRRLMIGLPFAGFAGIWGCFWDLAPVHVMGITMTGGVLSLCSILLRTILSVGAVLILVGTTPLRALSDGMRQLKIPSEMAQIFELMCRYLGILWDEAKAMHAAWRLRGGSHKGIGISHFGSFMGNLITRSFKRATRMFHAMQCRGGTLMIPKLRVPKLSEWLWTAILTISFIGLRMIG